MEEQEQLLEQIEFLLEAEDAAALGRLLNEQRSSDIAEIVELFDNKYRRVIFDVLEKPVSAAIFKKSVKCARWSAAITQILIYGEKPVETQAVGHLVKNRS